MKLRIARFVLAVASVSMPATILHAQTAATPKVNPLATQQQAVKDAQTAVENAKKQLLIIRKRVEATFVTKPEWVAAKEALDKAKIEYDMAQRRVTAAMEKNPEYTALIARKEKADAVILQSSKQSSGSSGDDVVKVSDEDLSAATKDRTDSALALIKMKENAGANDTAYLASKQKYVDAKAAFDALQVQVDDAVKLDPEYGPAQMAVETAETNLKQAKDQLAAAQKQQRPTPPPTPPPSSSGGYKRKGGG